MDISIIVINYNTTDLTIACLESIYKYVSIKKIELIVIDNASEDQSIQKVEQLFPDVKMIYNSENQGFGRANNRGILASTGKYVFLLNSDAKLTSDAASTFYDYMEDPHKADVACCGAALILPDGTSQFSYGNFPSVGEALSALGPGLLYRSYFRNHLSSGVKVYGSEELVVDYISGANLFIRRAALAETGLFDEDFFLYFEETELAFRMKLKGYKFVILPQVKIVHLEGGSTSLAQIRLKTEMYAKSRKLFFEKCRGRHSALFINKIYALQAIILFVTKRQKKFLIMSKVLFNT